MSTEPNKVIYSMVGVSKFYDKKAVLKDIYLSYFMAPRLASSALTAQESRHYYAFWQASTKSSSARQLSLGYTVGYLEQEPLIDDNRTVREVVEEAVQQTVSLLKEFDEINAKFGEEMSDEAMEKLLARQGEVRNYSTIRMPGT